MALSEELIIAALKAAAAPIELSLRNSEVAVDDSCDMYYPYLEDKLREIIRVRSESLNERIEEAQSELDALEVKEESNDQE